MFFQYFRKYVQKYPWYFWSGIGALAVTDILDVIPPLIMMRGVDQITSKASQVELLKTALIFAFATLCLAFVRFHWRMQFGKFHQNIARELRQDIFGKLLHLTPEFYSQSPTGELMSLVTNDVEAVRMGMGPGFVVLIDALFYFLTIPPIMLYLSVPLTIKSLILLPLLPFFVNWLGKIINKLFILEQEKFSEVSGIVQENIAGMKTVKSYVQEKNQGKIFNKLSADLMGATKKVALAETFMHPVMEFSVTLGVVTLLFFGTAEVVRGAITIGTFVAFQRYISKMVWPMTAMGWGFSLVSQASASLKRIDDLLKTNPDIKVANPSGEKMPLQNPTINVSGLTFKYPLSKSFALNNISFQIGFGETIGLIGSVASGKTTLAQLLCHLYRIDRGMISISGQDINDIDLDMLRNTITLVPQDPFLFSTTVKENIFYGVENTLSHAQLQTITENAGMLKEIENLPLSFDSTLGERGLNFSGGQKQRLTIARGLMRNTPIIIFDDSLSSVDSVTEKAILKTLLKMDGQTTTIIISHKISSLARCDRIIALKDGSVEAMGTPHEMKSKSEVYKTLLEHQSEMSHEPISL